MIRQMPIKATPYAHQREAFEFALELFGLTGSGDDAACEARKGVMP